MVTQENGIEVTGAVFKHEDTTRQIELKFHKERYTYYHPDAAHTFTVKVANASGLVGSYVASPEYNSIIVTSASMVELPPDDYTMEIWETWTDDNGTKQTAIWPTPQMRINFKIEENIDDKTGTVIKQLGFQDVVNKAVEQAGLNLVVKAKTGEPGTDVTAKQEYKDGKNYVTITVPKGDKGDQGPKGETGDSAYQIWLHNGHTGTEQDFLADIKGERGAAGKDGKDGKDGTNGKDGKDGKPGPQGEPGPMSTLSMLDNGNIAIDGKDQKIGGIKEYDALKDSDDLNNTTAQGIYPIPGIPKNSPITTGEWGVLTVIKTKVNNVDVVIQTWHGMSTAKTYTRSYFGKWSAWKQLGGGN